METSEIKRFGRYEIVAELGRGAMGVVYKARDPQIDRMVAVKTVSLSGQEPEEEQEFRLRFLNEAQAAGRLHHSGIVSVFDVGEDSENRDPYLVLEYVSGESLNRILSREKKLPLATALQLAQEIAEALHYAHGQGVVHRDIKPANILITESGHAKIADFGIAKLNLAHFTLPGRVLGTPAYMAPEQLSGESCDGRSDLFSLGVILYVMCTGLSPFQGSSATTVSFKVANREPVAATALDMSLPPQLDAVISSAIAKNPNERYQTGQEFAEDLRILEQSSKPGSTNTSLQAMAATGTRGLRAPTRKTASRDVHPVAALARVQTVLRGILLKASLRDLILGAATVGLVVILVAQGKLLLTSAPTAAVPRSSGLASSSAASSDSAKPTSPAVEPAPPAPPAISAPKGARAKAAKVLSPAPREAVVPSATLDIVVQHQFKDATLFIWVDGKLALTRPLHGAAQKKLVVFNGVRGVESETMKVSAGKHLLRFRALSGDQTTDLSKTITADLVGGQDKSLQVTFDRHNTIMRLTWQ
jgi:eukaryotic-like serine/threonine-protein kinase